MGFHHALRLDGPLPGCIGMTSCHIRMRANRVGVWNLLAETSLVLLGVNAPCGPAHPPQFIPEARLSPL